LRKLSAKKLVRQEQMKVALEINCCYCKKCKAHLQKILRRQKELGDFAEMEISERFLRTFLRN
jgi:hypothetical protein